MTTTRHPSPRQAALAMVLSLASAGSFAHEGHGPSGPHWHATDVWGFVILAAVVAGAIAWWRGRS